MFNKLSTCSFIRKLYESWFGHNTRQCVGLGTPYTQVHETRRVNLPPSSPPAPTVQLSKPKRGKKGNPRWINELARRKRTKSRKSLVKISTSDYLFITIPYFDIFIVHYEIFTTPVTKEKGEKRNRKKESFQKLVRQKNKKIVRIYRITVTHRFLFGISTARILISKVRN